MPGLSDSLPPQAERDLIEGVLEALYAAIDDVNRLLPEGSRLQRSTDQIILGPGSVLDSLGLVNLIVSAERKLTERLGDELSLTEVVTGGQDGEVPTTIGDLCRSLTGGRQYPHE